MTRFIPRAVHFAVAALLLGLLIATVPAVAAPPAQAPQEIDISTVVDQINRWHLSKFRGYRFNEWISLGDVNTFNARIADGDVQAYLDPVYLDSIKANAAYVDCDGIGCSNYMNDMVLSAQPSDMPPQTMWHEAMHSIFDDHDSELLVSNDEMYTWYMEGVIERPLSQVLTAYEDEWNKGPDCDPERLQNLWDMFLRHMDQARDTGYGQITSEEQKEQLCHLTGFCVYPETILAGYQAVGMDQCQAVTPTSPAAPPPAAASNQLDLVFVIDVTGSMDDDIAGVKAAASNIVNTVAERNPDYRVAIVAFRDWNDSEGYAMFEDFPFTSDQGTIIANINSLSVGGGDDTPEAVFEALMRAIDSTAIGSWRPNVNKQIILMGDAPPHSPSQQGYTSAIVAQAAFDADPVVIQSIVVGNYGSFDTDAVEYFQELADLTDGNFFEAADASEVPLVLEQTIQDIPDIDGSSVTSSGDDDLEGIGVAIIAVFCLLLLVLLGVGAFVLLFLGKKKKRRRQPTPAAAYPQTPPQAPQAAAPPQARYAPPPPPATPEVNWREDTILRAPAMTRAEVVVTAGANVGQRYRVAESSRLGRAPDNEIVLPDPQASRHHAMISFNGAQFEIVDLGGANGTEVNGRRIDAPTLLQTGDVITIGGHTLTFHGE